MAGSVPGEAQEKKNAGADNAPPVIVVCGPTASGKSRLALDLATALGGTVINADSMQVYRELRVLTARPGPAEEAIAPHRLYGVLSGSTPCSAGRWRAMALAEIAACRAAGRRPILVGGTGLYLEALFQGLSPIPQAPAAIAEATRQRLTEIGAPALHAALEARDPATAARLKPGDSQRIAHAWAVLEATGRPLSAWQALPRERPALGARFVRVMPPRDALYAACDARFDAMMARGALDEVAALRDSLHESLGDSLRETSHAALPAMRALGVPALLSYLEGRITRAAAIEAAKRATRQYAKRQATWFRHRTGAPRMTIEKYSSDSLPEIVQFLS